MKRLFMLVIAVSISLGPLNAMDYSGVRKRSRQVVYSFEESRRKKRRIDSLSTVKELEEEMVKAAIERGGELSEKVVDRFSNEELFSFVDDFGRNLLLLAIDLKQMPIAIAFIDRAFQSQEFDNCARVDYRLKSEVLADRMKEELRALIDGAVTVYISKELCGDIKKCRCSLCLASMIALKIESMRLRYFREEGSLGRFGC
jgi:hypothetical protein